MLFHIHCRAVSLKVGLCFGMWDTLKYYVPYDCSSDTHSLAWRFSDFGWKMLHVIMAFLFFREPEGSRVLGGFFPAVSALLLAVPYEEHDVAISCKKRCITFQMLLHSNRFYFYWKFMSVIMEPDSPFLSRDQCLATKERRLILLKWKKSNNPLFWSHCSLSINYLVAWHFWGFVNC